MINPWFKDEMLDDISHALGRPGSIAQVKESYRNHYCCSFDGPTSHLFNSSPFWDWTWTINQGRDVVWFVTPAGKNHLIDAFKEQARG